MDGLFSHASPTPDPEPRDHAQRPVVSATIHVPGDAVQAAEGFLDYLHLWWPVGLYSVSGPGAQLWWDGQGLVEESEDGQRFVLGETVEWDPPLSVRVRVQVPGAEGDEWSMQVTDRGVSSLLTLSGPVPTAPPHASAQPVPKDLWDQVLGFYGRFMGVPKE